MDGRGLQALQELLNPESREENSEDLDAAVVTPYNTPGAIGQQPASTASTGRSSAGQDGDVWEADEVPEDPQFDHDDPRPEPRYEVVFSQNVGAEDIFLGMSGKNPTTAGCHQQIVRISLPDTGMEDVDLRVTDTFLDCQTPNHRLGLHLPHRVEGEKSRARWLAESHTLEITLQLNRQYEELSM